MEIRIPSISLPRCERMNKCVSSITSHPCDGVNPLGPSANFVHGLEIIDIVRHLDSSVFLPRLNIIVCDGEICAAIGHVDGTFVTMCVATLLRMIRLRLLSKPFKVNDIVAGLWGLPFSTMAINLETAIPRYSTHRNHLH